MPTEAAESGTAAFMDCTLRASLPSPDALFERSGMTAE